MHVLRHRRTQRLDDASWLTTVYSAGEVIAGKPGRGAAYGAAIGAVGGAIVGCERSNECWNRARNNDRRYDPSADRYYYVDPQYGDTWWENGEFRSYGRGRP